MVAVNVVADRLLAGLECIDDRNFLQLRLCPTALCACQISFAWVGIAIYPARFTRQGPNFFSMNLEDGRSFCNSQCGRGWDIISLEQELTGVDFAKAKAEVFQIIGRVNGNGHNAGNVHSTAHSGVTLKPQAPLKPVTAKWVREKLELEGFRYNSHADFGDFARHVRFEHVEKMQAGKGRPEKTFRWEHRVDLDGDWFSGAGERAIQLFFNATARRAGGGPFVVLVEGWNKSNALDAFGHLSITQRIDGRECRSGGRFSPDHNLARCGCARARVGSDCRGILH